MGLPRQIPEGDTLPSKLKQGIFTRFDEKRDERQQEGDTSDTDEKTNTPEFEDNKTR